MKIYWSYTQLPELSGYSAQQKHIIWLNLSQWETDSDRKSWWENLFLGILIGSFLLGIIVGAFNHRNSDWGGFIGGMIGIAIPMPFFYLAGINARRGVLKRYLESQDFSLFPVTNMSLFKPAKDKPAGETTSTESSVPVTSFDVAQRYDIYVCVVDERRLYENVKLVGIRTFDRITQFSSGAICGLLELEAADGARMLIPQYGIQMICLHGTQPAFRVLSQLRPPNT